MAHERVHDADARRRCELLLGLAAAQACANDMISAKETFVRAADLARTAGTAEQLARAALGLAGRDVALLADDPRSLPLLEEALAAVGPNGGVLRARLLARLACAQPDRAVERGPMESRSLEAIDLAQRLGDRATLAWVLHARVVLIWDPDNLDEMLALAEEMIVAAESAHDPEQAINGHLLRLELLVALGATAAAHDELAAAARVARELGLPYARWHVGVHETGLALLEGSFAEADALIDQGQHLSERASSTEARVTAVAQRFPLLLEQRCLDELRPALSEIALTHHPAVAIYRCLLARTGVGSRQPRRRARNTRAPRARRLGCGDARLRMVVGGAASRRGCVAPRRSRARLAAVRPARPLRLAGCRGTTLLLDRRGVSLPRDPRRNAVASRRGR